MPKRQPIKKVAALETFKVNMWSANSLSGKAIQT